MRFIALIAVVILLTACKTSTHKLSAADLPLDSLASRFVKDSVALVLEIPTSYQFISMKIDTVTGARSDEEMIAWISNDLRGSEEEKQRILTGTTGDSLTTAQYINSLEEGIAMDRKMRDSIMRHPFPPHSVHHLNIFVKYRALTKSGAIITETIDLYYNPKNKSFTLAEDYD